MPKDLSPITEAPWYQKEPTAEELKEILQAIESGKNPDLRGIYLWGVNLKRAGLLGVNLQGADLLGANLILANLQETDLQKANLQGTELIGANLRRAKLQRANIQGADLRNAYLLRSNLQWANLQRANLQGARLQKVVLKDTNLSQVMLKNQDLSNLDLQNCDFTEAILIGADLSGANISGACLDNANTAGWIIEGIICTHIRHNDGTVEYFKPGVFEERYTKLQSVAELIVDIPYSDFSYYTGQLIAAGLQSKCGGATAVVFKGMNALSNQRTQLEFLVMEELEEVKKLLQMIGAAFQDNSQEFKALCDGMRQLVQDAKSLPDFDDAITLRNNIPIPLTFLQFNPEAVQNGLNRHFTTLNERLQKVVQLIQTALG